MIADTVGPEISLYLNTSSFRSGDQVNASPMFYAEVTDESGINAAGAGIGHDITLTVDGGDPVILNSYFSYSLGAVRRAESIILCQILRMAVTH